MNFYDKEEVRLIHKHLEAGNFINYGISLSWIETVKKYIEHLECLNKTIKSDTARIIQSEIKRRCIDAGIYPAFVAKTVDRVVEDVLK